MSRSEERLIFDAARHIAAPDARRAYLEQACHDDADLSARVAALLRAHDDGGGFLLSPAVPLGSNGLNESPGAQIGPYKLVEQIGEGGFGVVYLAEQKEPIRRAVALKMLKAGMDTRQVVARFEAERQALAMMEHPNIARVFDAGTTPAGRPYFVMELVKGVPITRYCDEQQLPTRQRLELFAAICRAVQHAHQKGVIHRDLKPTNVLVAAYDGLHVPKVIDFGVAKALGERLTERTLITSFGGIIGTLEYMSPEQAQFNALDVDTRADIYSLGVLLYELLTETTPLMRERLREAGLTDALRLIREQDPPKPSARLSESKSASPPSSTQRKLDTAALAREVRGDLDWIVMKALEKSRDRRYPTAYALARDVERYLNNEHVEACPGRMPRRTAKASASTIRRIILSAARIRAASAWRGTWSPAMWMSRSACLTTATITTSKATMSAPTPPGSKTSRPRTPTGPRRLPWAPPFRRQTPVTFPPLTTSAPMTPERTPMSPIVATSLEAPPPRAALIRSKTQMALPSRAAPAT
jgi:eukaryotic-like serine/threonine-protein kinase